MTDAILGTTTTLKALDGDVEVELKPGTQSAEVITIKDRGVTQLRGSGRGDLKIGVQVVTPTKLDHKERELIKQFAAAAQDAGARSSRSSSRGCSRSCATASSTSEPSWRTSTCATTSPAPPSATASSLDGRRGAARRDGQPGARRRDASSSATARARRVAARSSTAAPSELDARRRGRRARRAPAAPGVVLVQALAKGDRDELAVQAATELGVDAVDPWAAAALDLALGGRRRSPRAATAGAAIVREATQAVDPAVGARGAASSSTTKQLAALAGDARGCSCSSPTAEARAARRSTLRRPERAATVVVLVVGPEGGIAPAELDALAAAGADAGAARRLGAAHLDGRARPRSRC